MNTIEVVGFKRADLGKKSTKEIRKEGNVPGVLYGGKEVVHFYVPMALLQPLIYTANAYFVELNIEGKKYSCILQDIQFHPVSDIVLHVDFFAITSDKPITMSIPIVFEGNSPGVAKGGMLVKKLRKLNIRAYQKDMPATVKANISKLELGKTLKVREISIGSFEILNSPLVPIAAVEIPRALRSKAATEAATEKK